MSLPQYLLIVVVCFSTLCKCYYYWILTRFVQVIPWPVVILFIALARLLVSVVGDLL
jgi:hypothetical protein